MDKEFDKILNFSNDVKKIAEYTEKLNEKFNIKHQIFDILYNPLTEVTSVMCRIECDSIFKYILESMLVIYFINKKFKVIEKYVYIDVRDKLRLGGVENLSKGIITNEYIVFDDFSKFINAVQRNFYVEIEK